MRKVSNLCGECPMRRPDLRTKMSLRLLPIDPVMGNAHPSMAVHRFASTN